MHSSLNSSLACAYSMQPTTLPDFVEFLVNPSSYPSKRNVTFFSDRVEGVLKFSKCNVESQSLLSTEDNLERIRRFKDEWFCELRGLLDEVLLSPPNFPHDGSPVEDESKTDLLRKSGRISALLRNKGNEYYKQKAVDKALRCYTLACSYAPKGSTMEALAYSNRSACFFETNNLQKCLQDIERFDSIWTAKDDLKVAERLAERKCKCLNKIQSNGLGGQDTKVGFDTEYFTLKCPSVVIPSAERFIGIRDDGLRGRHVANIGDKVIAPGTVVILEKPYIHVLLKTFSFTSKNCSACLRDLKGGGIPCGGCVFVLYCSEECASSSHQKLHVLYECKISPYLYELNMNRTVYLSLLILLKLTPAGFLEHLRSSNNPLATDPITSPTPIVGFSPAGTYDSTSYSTLYNLIYHNEVLSEADVSRYCADAVIVTEILDERTDFFSSINIEPVETLSLKDEFSKLLLLHQMNLPCNAHSLYKLDVPRNPTREQSTTLPAEVGAGAFPLLSMINHACDPNVVRVTLRNGVNAVITIQYIAPGQELLDNYGSHYALDGRKIRQSHLQTMYNFKCNCPACNEDWPNFRELEMQPDASGIRICPQCRLKLDAEDSDAFSDIMLSVQSKTVLKCLKCKWTESQHDWLTKFNNSTDKYLVAMDNMLDNKPVEAFSSGIECLKFFDARFLKPFRFVNLSQEVMKQALNLIMAKVLE